MTCGDETRGRRRRRDGSLSPEPSSRNDHQLQNDKGNSVRERTSLRFASSGDRDDESRPRKPSIYSRIPSTSRYDDTRDEDSIKFSDWHSEQGSRGPRRSDRVYIPLDEGHRDSSSEQEQDGVESVYSAITRSTGPRKRSIVEGEWDDLDDETLDEENARVHDWKSPTGEMNWFWACQIDVIPGYLATPWTAKFSTNVCIGAITVIIEALGLLTDFSQPVYIDSAYHARGLAWMRRGRSTFPPYGISAIHHHGTVISGTYSTNHFPGFRAPLFPIELIRHYGFQVDRHLPSDATNLRARLTELMALDAWLSYCGRQPEICGYPQVQYTSVPVLGVGDLLYTMPTLVQRTMGSFTLEFANLERTALEGGQQIAQQIAENLLNTLGWKVEGLAPAEKLFALVAMLRTAKMALCIAQGTDTSALRDILLNNVQVHLI